MGLPSQIVPVDLFGGLDTKTNEKFVVPGNLVELKDGIYVQDRVIQKRNGYTELGASIIGGTTITQGDRLGVFLDELLLFGGGRLFAYSPSRDEWADKGDVTPALESNRPILRNSAQQSTPDLATNGGVRCYVWADSGGGLRATVTDAVSGVAFQQDVAISASGVRPRVLPVGANLIVLFVDGQDLKSRLLVPSSPTTFQAEQTLRTDLRVVAGERNYDGVERVGSTSGLVAYYDTGGGVTVFYLREVGDVGDVLDGFPAPVSVAASNAEDCLGILHDPVTDDVYVAFHNATNGVEVFARQVDLSVRFAPVVLDSDTTVMEAITGVVEPTTTRWWYQRTASADPDRLTRVNTIDSSGTPGVSAVFHRSVGLAHKAFRQGGVSYVGLVYASTLQSTYFLANAAGFVAGKSLPLVAGGLAGDPILPRVDGTGALIWAALQKTRLISEVDEDNTNVVFSQIGLAETTWDFTAPELHQNAVLGKNLHIAGAVIGLYDGVAVVEAGFHIFPEGTLAVQGVAGALADGTYGIGVIYQWIDNQGQIHRSAPELVTLVIAAGGGVASIDLTIPTLRLTDKSNVTIEVFVTEANGLIRHRVTTTSTPLDNDPTVDTVALNVPSVSTTTEVLYTAGGILENIAPPAAAVLAVVKNRLFLGSGDVVFFSKEHVTGEGVAFTDFFSLQVDPKGGDLTALGGLDEKLVIFKKDNIYVVFGDGPNDAGRLDTFSEPQLVTTDVGATDQAVVSYDRGLMFKSALGLYTLLRSLTVEYTGANVEAFNGLDVSSAVLLDTVNQIRFTTADGEALMYDTFFGKWASWTNHVAVDAIIQDGRYHYLRADGRVRREAPGFFRDVGVPVRLDFTTAWIPVAGIQGFQRVRRVAVLGDFLNSHLLRMEVGYDYKEHFEGIYTLDPDAVLDAAVYGSDAFYGDSDVYGGVEDSVYQFRAPRLQKQKCEAIRFRFRDVAGTEAGFTISMLTLEVALKAGIFKLKAGKSLTA